MIKHVVMFKVIEFDTNEQKMAKLNEVKSALERLIDKIDVLRKIEVHFNVNPAETWDFILETELDKLEDVNIYANHPEHVAVATNLIKPIRADRACVDYEF